MTNRMVLTAAVIAIVTVNAPIPNSVEAPRSDAHLADKIRDIGPDMKTKVSMGKINPRG